MAVSNTKRIVLLGKTGAGKSSLGNTIFKEKSFTVGSSANSVTIQCQKQTKNVNGRLISLIDTPGLFDPDRPEEKLKAEIVSCITTCSPGPHAFIIVLQLGRFTEQEQAVINKILEYFSEEVFKYTTLVFTHGDDLDEGQTVEQYFSRNKAVKELMRKCGGRCHVIDNKYWNNDQQNEYRSNKFQVKELLKTIDEITEANRGGCYTNEMLQAWEAQIQEEEERIRNMSPNMSEAVIREQAEISTANKMLIKLAGCATGVLLGALLGVVSSVGVVLIVIRDLGIPLISLIKAGKAAGGIATAGLAAAGGGASATATAGAGLAAAGGGASASAAAAAAAAAAVAGEATTAAAVGGAAAGGASAAAVAGEATTAAAVGGAAAGGASAAAVAGGVVLAVAAAVGGGIGGFTGYHAAEDAETAKEGAEKAARAVFDGAMSVFDKTNDFMERLSHRKKE